MTDLTARLHFYLKDEGNDSRSEAYQLIQLSLAEINRCRNCLDYISNSIYDFRKGPIDFIVSEARKHELP